MSPEIQPDPEALQRQFVSTENAARLLALDLRSKRTEKVVVLATSGPAGAVGLAAARHLFNYGGDVQVFFVGVKDTARQPAAAHLEILDGMRVPLGWIPRPEEIPDVVKGLDGGSVLLAACAAEDAGPRAEAAESEIAALEYPGTRFVRYEGGVEAPVPEADLELPSPPEVALTRDEVRTLDNLAIERHHIPGIVLMENAGWRLAVEAFKAVRSGELPEPLLVLCGRGNNGGDGFVAARHLRAWGIKVEVLLVGGMEPATDDAALNFRLYQDCGGKVKRGMEEDAVPLLVGVLKEAGSLMDALLGTGLKGEIRGLMGDVLTRVSETELPAMAVDIPSGVDADTGKALGPVKKALRTVTFAARKTGFEKAPEISGEVVVADIGAPWYLGPWLASRRAGDEAGEKCGG